MKVISKRITALILCLILAFSVLTPISAYAAYENDLPVIFVAGKTKTIYNKNGQVVYPMKKSVVSCIKDNQDAIVSAATKGVLGIGSGKWSSLKNVLDSTISPLFADLVLNEKGEISNGSYTNPKKPYTTPVNKKTSNYGLYDYQFIYDWRLDPVALAEDLNDYIDLILAATGKSKVQLVTRCLGSSIAAAYLTKYGADRVDTCTLYSGSAMGIIPASAFFSGHLRIDGDSLNRYANNAGDDAEYIEVIKMFSSLLKSSALIKNITDRNFQEGVNAVLPDLLLKTYATMPSYWSMVSDEYYEDAKAFIFNGRYDKYAGLIEKIDNYHYNVQQQFPAVLKMLQDGGLKVAIIAKYNYEMAPIFENGDLQSDDTIEVDKQAFGATAARFGQTLTDEYIQQAKANGFGDNISADSIIDASTCLFPECTWFIKDENHGSGSWPAQNKLIPAILHSKKQFTIHSDKNFPQFLQYNAYTGNLDKLAAKYTVQAVSLSPTVYSYTGSVQSPKPNIINSAGLKLTEGTDYTLSYSSGRKNVGTYRVDVLYNGIYAGRKTDSFTFDIVPANVTSLKGTPSANSVKLTWDADSNADGYIVYKYDTASKSYKTLKTIAKNTTTSYTASGLTALTSYQFAVKAYKTVSGKQLTSQSYAAVTSTTLPATPTIKVKASTKSAIISWSKCSGATGYQVYMSTLEGGTFKKVGTTTSTSYTQTGLSSGNTYYFKVRAYATVNNKTVYGSYSPAIMTEGTNKPAAPTVSLSTSSGKVKVSWSKVNGADKYYVYMATSKNGTYKNVGSTKNAYYNVSSLKPGQTYYFKVKSYTKVSSKGYYSGYSSVKSIKVSSTPATPSNVKVTPSSKSAIVSWDKVTGASKYYVYMATSKNGTYKKLGSTKSTSYNAISLTAGKTYYFKVKAYAKVDSKGYYSGYSSAKSAKVTNTPAKTTLKATAQSKAVKLTWSAVPGANKYQVYMATSKDGTYKKIKTTSSTEFTKSGLNKGKTYYFKVRAYSKVSSKTYYGSYSSIKSAKVK